LGGTQHEVTQQRCCLLNSVVRIKILPSLSLSQAATDPVKYSSVFRPRGEGRSGRPGLSTRKRPGRWAERECTPRY